MGASAGLHVLAWLPAGIDEAVLVRLAAEVGVGVEGVTPYRSAGRIGAGGLFFGYGTVTEAPIEEGIRLIASKLDQARTLHATG